MLANQSCDFYLWGLLGGGAKGSVLAVSRAQEPSCVGVERLPAGRPAESRSRGKRRPFRRKRGGPKLTRTADCSNRKRGGGLGWPSENPSEALAGAVRCWAMIAWWKQNFQEVHWPDSMPSVHDLLRVLALQG